MHPTCREYTPFAPRGSSLHPARRRMHPTCFPSCTPFAPQGKQKCTPPKSEMHPLRRFYQNMRPNTIKDAVDDTIHCVFYSYAERKGLERLNATVRWTVAADGSTEANLNFRQRRKCKRVPSGVRRPLGGNNPSVSLFG